MYPAARNLFSHVDYRTVHTPLTDETRDLVDAQAIATLKKWVRLINCARGGIYNEEALALLRQTCRPLGVRSGNLVEGHQRLATLLGEHPGNQLRIGEPLAFGIPMAPLGNHGV